MPTNHATRLSPEQFKAVVIGKGWTFRELAKHWEMTPVWLSKLSSDPQRSSHYDDAVMGLPSRGQLARSLKRRQDTANAYLLAIDSKPRKGTGAYRYHEYLAVGTILAIFEDCGSMAEAGMRGIVFSVLKSKSGEKYGVVFENGRFDWFTCDDIDRYMVSTGLTDESSSSFSYTSDEELKLAFAASRFIFWPNR